MEKENLRKIKWKKQKGWKVLECDMTLSRLPSADTLFNGKCNENFLRFFCNASNLKECFKGQCSSKKQKTDLLKAVSKTK